MLHPFAISATGVGSVRYGLAMPLNLLCIHYQKTVWNIGMHIGRVDVNARNEEFLHFESHQNHTLRKRF
jgi:hypothetical protein